MEDVQALMQTAITAQHILTQHLLFAGSNQERWNTVPVLHPFVIDGGLKPEFFLVKILML